MHAPRPGFRSGLAALLLTEGLILAILLGDGLFSGGARVVGSTRTETWAFLWGHWCTKHSLVDLGRFPFRIDFLDFPYGGVLWLKDPLFTLLLLPVQLVWGIPAAFTVEQVLLFLLAGIGAWLLAREVGLGSLAAVGAGLAFAFCPHSLGEVYNGNLEALASGFAPLWLFALLRVVRRPAPVPLAGAAVALFLLLSCNPYYAFAMAVASVPVLAVGLHTTAAPRRRALAFTAAAVAAGGLAFAPVAARIVASIRAPDHLALIEPVVSLKPPNVSDLLHLVRPLAELEHAPDPPPPFQDLVYPGFLLVAATLAGIRWAPRTPWRWLWPLLALGFLVLSLGPALSVNGRIVGAPDRVVWLPWGHLAPHLGFLDRLTLPHRFAVPAGLFWALGLGGLLQGMSERLPVRVRTLAPVLLVGAALGEILLYPPYRVPLESLSTRVWDHVRLLAHLPRPGAVLDLPLYLGSNPRRIYLWHQSGHERPVDTAIRVGRPPTVAREVPFLQQVLALQGRPPDPGSVAPGPEGAQALGRAGYAYVVLHLPLVYDSREPDPAVWLDLLDTAVGDGLLLEEGTVILPLDQTRLEALERRARQLLGEDAVRGRVSTVAPEALP